MVLAERADLSVGYLCDLEAGKKWGTPETISKLAAALNVQPFQLFLPEENEAAPSVITELLALSADLKQSIDVKITALMEKYR